MINEKTFQIDDISLLKITKIRPWFALNFDYDGNHFLLHEEWDSDDGCRYTQLYKKECDENGRYSLTEINWSYDDIFDFIKENNAQGLAYKNIDKEYFLRQLTKNDFVFSKYSIPLLEEKIKQLTAEQGLRDFYSAWDKGRLNELNRDLVVVKRLLEPENENEVER